MEELLFSFQATKITVIKTKISTVFIYLLILIGRRNMGLIIIFPHFLLFRCRRFDQSAPGCGIKRLEWFIGFCCVHWGMSSFSCHRTLKISVACCASHFLWIGRIFHRAICIVPGKVFDWRAFHKLFVYWYWKYSM